MTFSIALHENPITSTDFIGDITDSFESWRHSTRALGGCWQGEGQYVGTPAEMENFFLDNLGKVIRVSSGGIVWWEGQIVEMELVKNGRSWTRTMLDMANYTKTLYSKIGPNLLSNPNMEAGSSWLIFGTPSEAASSGSWYSSGSTSMYVVSDAENEGVIPGSGITIASARAYDCSVISNVASGTWTVSIVDEATSSVITQRTTNACGRTWLQTKIPDDNAFTSIDFNLLSGAAGEEAYFDGAILRTSPERAETQWHVNAESASAYGRIESVILRGSMTDSEADGEALKELTENAWPQTKSPERGGSTPQAAGLRITCMGLSWTFSWRHTLLDGTDEASNHITSLVGESELFDTDDAIIDSNTNEVFLEAGNPQPLWRVIEKIAEAGDGSGNPWMVGTYPEQVFRFNARPTDTLYESRGVDITWIGGGKLPPLEFRPGYCYMVDMPVALTPADAEDQDNPKRIWFDETWFIYERGVTYLDWARRRQR